MAVTRGLFRTDEIATRTALGATPGRILGLLAADAGRVAVIGCAGALGVASLGLAAVLPVLPPQFTTIGTPSMTARVVLFVLVASVIAGASWCGASVLAWRLGAAGKRLHVYSGDGRAIRIVRFVVVAGQLAAASVLLAGSALLGRSYLNLLAIDTGLDARVQTLVVAHDPEIPVALRRETVERTVAALRNAGGLSAAGASSGAMLDGTFNPGTAIIDGQVVFPHWTFVAGEYFKAMGLPFVAGGPPAPSDAEAIVITESAVREWFGGRNPVGRVIALDRPYRVAGVIPDVRSRGLTVAPRPGIYAQHSSRGWSGPQPQTTYVLRQANDAVPGVAWERILRDVDPMSLVMDSGTVGERLDRTIRDRTFATLVAGLFAMSSLLVVSLGLAGVVAYTVVKRTREMAIRLALGSTAEGVMSLVVRDALTAGTCGVVAGVVASVWLSRGLESLLYGVAVADAATLSVTAAGLLGIVIGAAMLPGLRAARIAPATALRIE
jgi:hypothetical protein